MQVPGGPYIGSVTSGTWFLDNLLSNSYPTDKEDQLLQRNDFIGLGFCLSIVFRTFSSCQQLSTTSVWMSNVWLGVSMSFHFYSFFSCSSIAKILLFFMRKLHTSYEFFRVLVNLEISDLHDLDTVLCCVIMPKVSFSLLEDYEFVSTWTRAEVVTPSR